MSGKDEHEERNGERRRVAMVAVAWFARMRAEDRSAEDERRFQAWIDEDESHAAAFASIESMWTKVGGLEALPGFHAMRQEALQTKSTHLTHFWRNGRRSDPAPTPRARPGRRAIASIAAAVVLMVAGGLFGGLFAPDRTTDLVYQTAAGERSTKTLEDGSLVTMTSNSRLKVAFSGQIRRVVLTKGEAFFDVAHDPDRPFRVEAGSGMVTALGTEFDVYKKNGEVVVTLIEGSVEVAALDPPSSEGGAVRQLRPGERISYDHSGLFDVQEADVDRTISWRQGRLVIENKPLLDVIDEMNRHSSRQLEVDRNDPRLRTLLVNGQFKTGRPEALVEYLRAGGYKVWVTEDARGNITLRLRGEQSHG